MKKIIVIGCPGSGKSTLSKKLHHKLGIPVIHLDMLYWNSDKTRVNKEDFDKKLEEVLIDDSWIIDGNFRRTLELRIKESDTVIFLDEPSRINSKCQSIEYDNKEFVEAYLDKNKVVPSYTNAMATNIDMILTLEKQKAKIWNNKH